MLQRCGHQSQYRPSESFHAKFKNNFNHSHLNRYALVEAIKTVQIDACVTIRSSKNLKALYKKSTGYSFNTWQIYENKTDQPT